MPPIDTGFIGMGLRDYILMIRPVNCFMTGIGVVFAIMVYENTLTPSIFKFLTGFLTGFLGCAAPMLINDYVDRGVDAVNKPWKPIPSSRVNAEIVLVLSIVFLIIPLPLNLFLGVNAFLVATFYMITGYFYSFLRRYWWSHGIVALSTTAPVVYGYIVAGAPQEKLTFTILFASTMFVVTLGREIVKAVMDIEGDKKYGYVTLPIKYGADRALETIPLMAVTGSTLGVLAGILGHASIAYLVLILVAGGLYTLEAFSVYRSNDNKQVLEKARKNMLGAMMIGLLAFWFSDIGPVIQLFNP